MAFGVDQIDLDPCSNDISVVNAKVEFKLPDVDGLNADWNYPTIWCNPPYGVTRLHRTDRTVYEGKWSDLTLAEQLQYNTQNIGHWIAKCARSYELFHSNVIALIPVAPETKAWRVPIWRNATGICYINKRIKFIDPRTGKLCTQGFTKAQCLVYWGNNYAKFEQAASNIGETMPIGRYLKGIMSSYYHDIFDTSRQ